MLAGSVATAISDLIDDPSSILSTLGASLPAISVFFINYSLNVLFVNIPLNMLRAGPLGILQIYRYFFDEKALTRRQIIEGPLAKESLDYGTELPNILYYMALVVIYWTIAPILVGILSCVLFVSTITWKYKMMYVYVPEYESGGLFWYRIYKFTMYSLVSSIVTMVGYFGLKEGIYQASGLIPLLYIVYRVWGYTEDCYKDISIHVAYSTAVDFDCRDDSEIASKLNAFDPDYFRQPDLNSPKIATLEAYRINRIPLWTDDGNLATVYYSNETDSKGTEKTFGADRPSTVEMVQAV